MHKDILTLVEGLRPNYDYSLLQPIVNHYSLL